MREKWRETVRKMKQPRVTASMGTVGIGTIHDKHLVTCCRFRVTSSEAKTGISERQRTQQPKLIGAHNELTIKV